MHVCIILQLMWVIVLRKSSNYLTRFFFIIFFQGRLCMYAVQLVLIYSSSISSSCKTCFRKKKHRIKKLFICVGCFELHHDHPLKYTSACELRRRMILDGSYLELPLLEYMFGCPTIGRFRPIPNSYRLIVTFVELGRISLGLVCFIVSKRNI